MRLFLKLSNLTKTLLALILVSYTITEESKAEIESFTYIKVEADKSLTWNQIDILNRTQQKVSSGTLGNHIAYQDWGENNLPFAIISRTESDGKDTITLSSSGGSYSIQNGEYFFPVPNINGMHGSELSTIYDIRGRRGWYITLDPLHAPDVKRFALGRSGHIPTYFQVMDRRGSNTVFASLNPSGRTVIMEYRSLDRRIKGRVALKGFPRHYLSNPSIPIPIRIANMRYDGLLISWEFDNKTYYRIINPLVPKRSVLFTGSFDGTGTLLVGNYLNKDNDQVVLFNRDGIQIHDNHVLGRKASNEVIRFSLSDLSISADAIPIDKHNVNTFKLESEKEPSSKPNNCNDLAKGERNRFGCFQESPSDGGGGFVWKPNSDTQHWAVTVLPPNLTGCVDNVGAYDTNMSLIQDMPAKGGPANGNRQAYMSAGRTGADYRRQYRSIVVRAKLKNGACLDYKIDNPHQRVD